MSSNFELLPLFSGSSGNSILVRVGGLNLLFDCGHSCKRITEALTKVSTDPNSINALFLTHSHSDHISGADVFVRKYQTPVYASSSTLHEFNRWCKKPHALELDNVLMSKEVVFDGGYGDVVVRWCETPHDAAGSVCYRVDHEGKSCMVMTDLGHVTPDIMDLATGVDGILIEANYDNEMLIYGPYDYQLKKRVGGLYGHLSNEECANTMIDLIASGTRKFILGHLSENNNVPELALGTVVSILLENNYKLGEDYELRVAKRYEPTEGIVILP